MFNIHFFVEKWKWNADFGIYVSNRGRFRTRDKKDLPIKVGNGGYCYVYCEGTINQYRLAHRVVMLTWCPTDDAENLTVDHLDHNKRNNAVDNLEWVTKEENLSRAEKDYIDSVVVKTVVKEVEKYVGLPKSKYNKYIKFTKSGVVMSIEQVAKFFFDTHHHTFRNVEKNNCCLTLEDMEKAIYANKKAKLFGIYYEKISR